MFCAARNYKCNETVLKRFLAHLMAFTITTHYIDFFLYFLIILHYLTHFIAIAGNVPKILGITELTPMLEVC